MGFAEDIRVNLNFSRTIVIYYYTSLESLTGIFPLNESQTINLFATHFKFLNDKEEISLGKKLRRDIQKTTGKTLKPLNPFKDPYILSFSQSPDNLPMWGMYGKNGYTPYIVKKFPKEVLSSVLIGPISNSRNIVEKVKLHLTKFGYDNVIVNTSRIPYRG